MTKQRAYVYGMRREILVGEIEAAKTYIAEIVAGDPALTAQINEKVRAMGEAEFYQSAKRLILQVIDMMWMEHLEAMEYLKSSVNLRAYGQRDPLIEYKKDGLRMFNDMKESVQSEIIRLLPAIGAGAFAKEEAEARERVKHALEVGGGEDASSTASPIHAEEKPGRNDLCYCGSGKKFKKCHGA
jgi:preprotein translocase subunit SecA